MKRIGVVLLAVALLGAWPPATPAQAPQTVSRVFSAPYDRMWTVVEAVLKSLDWSIDERDKSLGWILTNSKGLDFKDFGVYGEGTRHKLRISLKAQTEGWTAVSVERELYREERILWMTQRKPVEASDRSVEFSVLAAIEKTIPAVAGPAAGAPVPAPGAPSGPPPSPTAAVRPGARGEFTVKVTYRVKGTAGSAHLTYRNADGGTVQTSVRLPWEASFDAKGGTFLSVSAQNQGVTGSVTCEILLDGESRTTSTSSGAYVIAECSNSADRN